MNDWLKSAPHWRHVIDWIRQTPEPSTIAWDRVVVELDSSLQLLPLSALTRVPPGTENRIGGGFVFEGGVKKIYLDLGAYPLGVLAPLLVHELIHAYDAVYLSALSTLAEDWDCFKLRSRNLQAAWRHDANSRTLYADLRAHEQRLEELRRREQNILYAAECHAYSGMFAWIERQATDRPEYRKYLSSLPGFIFDRPITAAEIKQSYALSLVA